MMSIQTVASHFCNSIALGDRLELMKLGSPERAKGFQPAKAGLSYINALLEWFTRAKCSLLRQTVAL
jgi:hypothetical protein